MAYNPVNPNGQAAMVASAPVVIASNQSAVPISGTVTANAGTGTLAVSLAIAPTTPVTGTFWQATQPVSGTVTANAGTGTLAVSLAALPALTTGAAVIGALVANQSTNTVQLGGVAITLGSGVTGTGVQRVSLATDVILAAVSELRSATLHVTATAAANTLATATLPAAGAGLFHYITHIYMTRNATAVLAGTATLIHTSTNLPGSPAWSVGNAMVAGGTQLDMVYSPATPLRSAVANTATTLVMAAGGAAVLNRINVSYFTAV